ncbi:4Fe-4S dicluster domain-containing protein [Lutibacter sp.]|uniref:4Fe-4S dicluster domain-containing protein n=1 Tax=Lutibacter sp. TaxID=1925666 RepID=UPI002734AADA|nr:4Fe-4S dicluster domain-containing protein [Lutibacter sp.]MDP3314007.1 4Fe-4S dicluster domain-containing protein [Lutibacter sp.]
MENNKKEESLLNKKISRKDFFKSAAVAGASALVASEVFAKSRFLPEIEIPIGESTIKEIAEFKSVKVESNSDILIRMQAELKKALAKPMEQRKWKMIIDTRKCVGCHACTVSCIAENKLPKGVIYRPVTTVEMGTYPDLKMRFLPQPCMQCETPSCVPVCPVNATGIRPDGIVHIDYEVCIGCGNCVEACPYEHRSMDTGENYCDETPSVQPYELLPTMEYGKDWTREGKYSATEGSARKCSFCLHRLDVGQLPQCVTTCIGRATYFGDINDPTSFISEMATKPNQMKLLEEKGTNPTVTYII